MSEKKKYRVPVGIIATASKGIGVVEGDTLEEIKEEAEKLWESQGWDHPNCSNDFDLGDWWLETDEMEEKHLAWYENKDEEKATS